MSAPAHPASLAREAVLDPRLVRPDWTTGVPRNKQLLWLDRNENTDPDFLAVTSRVMVEVMTGPDRHAICTYPESAPFYSKLAAFVGVRPENLTLAPGSDGVIRSVFEAFMNPGDTVAHTHPTFAMYPVYSLMYGVRAVPISYQRMPAGPRLGVEDVLAAVNSERPKLVCIPNPDSPTGTVFDPAELRAIVDACGRSGALVLVDEAYHPFYPHSAAPWVDECPHLVVARTFAKAWGLAGLRIGYAVAHPTVAMLLHKVRPMYEVNTVAVAVVERLLDAANEMLASVGRLNGGRDYWLDAMEALNLPTVRARGNFLHVAFGAYEPAIYNALKDLVLYRRDGGEGCLSGYSRFSATTITLCAPLVDRICAEVTRR
jgi:histidinol-phosphate aminotransferase